MDKATDMGVRVNFAKLCVEMDGSKPSIDKIPGEVDDGQNFEVTVELGHDSLHCDLKLISKSISETFFQMGS